MKRILLFIMAITFSLAPFAQKHSAQKKPVRKTAVTAKKKAATPARKTNSRSQRRVQGSVRHIDQCIKHRQAYICYIGIDKFDGFCLSFHTIPKTEDGKYGEWQTRQDEI